MENGLRPFLRREKIVKVLFRRTIKTRRVLGWRLGSDTEND